MWAREGGHVPRGGGGHSSKGKGRGESTRDGERGKEEGGKK
jgi:hypothetical protein